MKLEEAGDIGADLVLKGAFTRSRFRQIVFGGTTQHIDLPEFRSCSPS